MPLEKIDTNVTKVIITDFIKRIVTEADKDGIVFGFSGGLDSTVCLYLAVMALGKKRVKALILPYKESSRDNITDAQNISKAIGVDNTIMDISPIVDVYFKALKINDKIRKGNFLARIRMAIIYDFAKKNNDLVMGTSNKSERLIGYSTLWGDSACDFMPIGDLYKTQVNQLAAFLKVPAKIINKKPSADLWEGQTDEDEIGCSYEDIDTVLSMVFDKGWGRDWVYAEGCKKEVVDKILEMYSSSKFKRQLPPFPKIITANMNNESEL